MNEQEMPVREMNEQEFDEWFEHQLKNPLYIDSDYFEGMSLSYANPALFDDGDEWDQPAASS